jgi:hypothetical protein
VYLTHLEKPIFEASHAMEGTLLLSHLFPFFAFPSLFFCLQKSMNKISKISKISEFLREKMLENFRT